MANSFKKLLLKIASLSLKDQKWLIHQLNAQQQALFEQHQGATLLAQARRFKSLTEPKEAVLPELGHQLAQYPAVYIAIILEQGAFPWQQLFIEHYPELLPQKEHEVKSATKALLFQQWKSQWHN